MKIWCDVCDNAEASVFCYVDEAALCDGCDRRVHHANKLASKHVRLSLLHPSFKESPLCDICQERRAFHFCKEDRALLCRECDISIHKANEYTQKHNRFLLTGVKLSAASSLYPTPSSSNGSEASDGRHQPNLKRKSSVSVSNEIFGSASAEIPSPPSTAYNVDDSQSGSITTSSISEYLETVPGWHVDDLLGPSLAADSFCGVWSAPFS